MDLDGDTDAGLRRSVQDGGNKNVAELFFFFKLSCSLGSFHFLSLNFSFDFPC